MGYIFQYVEGNNMENTYIEQQENSCSKNMTLSNYLVKLLEQFIIAIM